MSEGRVVHVNDNVEGAVYIGRENRSKRLEESLYANPFKIGRDGTRDEVIDAYRLYIYQQWTLLSWLPKLRGKPLACWCRHDGRKKTAATACHGDVLLEILEIYSDDELRAMVNR